MRNPKKKSIRAEAYPANARPSGAPWRKAALVGGFVVPWLIAALAILSAQGLIGSRPSRSAAAENGALDHKLGPWGRLQAVQIELNAPEPATLSLCRTNLPVWFFGSTTSREQLSAFFKQAGCTAEQTDGLVKTARAQAVGWTVAPDAELLLSLSKATRARISFHLSDFPENTDQHYAMRWPKVRFKSWLDTADIAPRTKQLLAQLTYEDDTHVYFSSEPLLTRLVDDDAERTRLCDALLRSTSMIVTLGVKPGDDVENLVRYWGAGGHEREVRPILEALARLPAGGEIDVVNLLPSTAQDLLHTYPRLDQPYTDCHWASFNFFNPAPEKRPINPGESGELYTRLFTPIPGPPRLGDLVLFNDHAGNAQHSAVYIADDIVFTKNGRSPKKPWVFMRLGEVQNTFWKESRISYARRKA